VGTVAVAGAAIGTATHPHPPTDPPFVVAGASTPVVGAAGSLAVATAISAPMGTVAGHPLAGVLFLTAGASTPTSPATSAARRLDAAVGAAGPWATAAITGTPAWPSFDPSMGRAPYWSTPQAFFVAPQYGFPVQPA
jgi:hypothetical protein